MAYSLKYFPAQGIEAKCGCQPTELYNPKFFSKHESDSMVDPIVEEYLLQMREFDGLVLAQNDSSSNDKEPSDPTPDVCKKDDESCIEYKAQCTASCTMKCKTEPSGKQKQCISICIRQCMSTFGIVSQFMNTHSGNLI